MHYKNAVTDVAAQPPGGLRNAVAMEWADIVLKDSSCTETFRQLFGIKAAARADVSVNCRTTRAVNVLQVNGLTDTAALLDRSPGDLSVLKNCGRRTVFDIVRAILLTIASIPHNCSIDSGEPADSLFQIEPESYATAEVLEPALPGVAVLLDRFLAELDERERMLFRHRIAYVDRKLADFGQEYGISGERVRQIELKVRQKFNAWRTSPTIVPVLLALRQELGVLVNPLRPYRRLLEDLPDLNVELRTVSLPLGSVLPLLVSGVCFDGTWISMRPLDELRRETLQLVTTNQASRTDGLHAELLSDEREWDDWLAYCGLTRLGDSVIRNNATLAERAKVILRQVASPLTANELAERVGHTSVRNVRNYLLADEEIARLGPQLYGLAEWKMETYEGIREEIRQRIVRAGGRIRREYLVDELSKQFNVSPDSVRVYASGREFTREGDWLSLSKPYSPRRTGGASKATTPEETRRTFRHGGVWWYRLDIGREMLRGSGFPVPKGVAALFGVAVGARRELASEAGPIRITWTGNQPTMGSVRAVLDYLDVEDGDILWIAPGDEDTAQLRHVPKPPASAEPCTLVAHLCGIDIDLPQAQLATAVAAAVGRGAATGWRVLSSILRARGDSDVAAKIDTLASTDNDDTTTVDDFLEALRGDQ